MGGGSAEGRGNAKCRRDRSAEGRLRSRRHYFISLKLKQISGQCISRLQQTGKQLRLHRNGGGMIFGRNGCDNAALQWCCLAHSFCRMLVVNFRWKHCCLQGHGHPRKALGHFNGVKADQYCISHLAGCSSQNDQEMGVDISG